MTELKPCPFCGKPINKEDYRTYSCGPCGYALVMDVFKINGEEFERDYDAVWNRRATGPKSLHNTMKKYREKCGEPVVDDRTVE